MITVPHKLSIKGYISINSNYLFVFTFIICNLLFTQKLSSQVSRISALGGEVWYELNSQNSINGNLNVHYITYRNPTKGGSFAPKLSVFNYPMTSYVDRGSIDTVKLNCNAIFVDIHVQPTVQHWYNGVYVKNHFFTTLNMQYNSPPITLPFLSPPPVDGWVLAAFSDLSARDTTAKNLVNFPYNPTTSPISDIRRNNPALYTRIYPFPNISGPHSDISPRFTNDAVIICTSGDTINYNPNIYDADGDSISVYWDYHINGYHFAQYVPSINAWPIGGLPQNFNQQFYLDTATYKPGYDFDKPLPDASFNPNNIPATLDTNTGEIYFCCNNPGNYSAAVNVNAYRNGYLLSTTHREIFFTIFPADSNNEPIISNTNNYFSDTIYAGDSVSIPFVISDFDTLQKLTFSAQGFALDSNYIAGDTNCVSPPCAGFSILPSDTFLAQDSGVFFWQTACSHTSAFNNSVNYSFTLNAKDDNCNIAGQYSKSINITILKPPRIAAVDLHCASVSQNGEVSLSWSPYIDSTGLSFKYYIIWQSDNINGSYSIVDTIFNINQSTYPNISSNANNDTVFFFVETISSCNPLLSAFSDTIASIYLNLINTSGGIANLYWNNIFDSLYSTDYYNIYRSIDGGSWQIIDSVNALSYTDTVSVCSMEVSYYVSLANSSGCASISNIVSDIFTDTIAPLPITWDTISVSSGNNPLLAWQDSQSLDVVAYIIYNQGIAIDTIWNANSYNANSIIANELGSCFSIVAMDSCFNKSSSSAIHCTASLSLFVDKCANTIKLSWIHNSDTNIINYDIFFSENSGAFQLLTTVNTLDSVYIHTTANANSTYCYFIRQNLSNNRSSSSNRACTIADFSPSKGYIKLRLATVANNDFVRLKIQSDTTVNINNISIERMANNESTYSTIANISSNNLPLWYFNDAAVDVHNRYYKYRIISHDKCNNKDTSNYAQTILLNIEQKNGNINQLQWNSYQQWSYGVDYYIIHRIVQQMEVFPYITVANTNALQYAYNDDVSEFENYSNEFCYSIEALDASANIDTSFSNTACIARNLDIYIPNAFHPGGGINDVFKPIIPFLGGNYYQMIIYNRWGEKIFETNDINTGWDGNYKHYSANSGVYIYVINFISNGEKISKKGSFTLIR